jgi:hypothetical protein
MSSETVRPEQTRPEKEGHLDAFGRFPQLSGPLSDFLSSFMEAWQAGDDNSPRP